MTASIQTQQFPKTATSEQIHGLDRTTKSTFDQLFVRSELHVLVFHRVKSNCVRRCRNLLSFRTNMTMKEQILWSSESLNFKFVN